MRAFTAEHGIDLSYHMLLNSIEYNTIYTHSIVLIQEKCNSTYVIQYEETYRLHRLSFTYRFLTYRKDLVLK